MATTDPRYRLSAILKVENMLVEPEAEDRLSVVKALLRNLVDTGRVAQTQLGSMLRLVNEREELGTTAVGGGLAVPHARANIEEPVLAFALLKDGREGWKPLDDAPVYGVFLFITPKAEDKHHQGLLKSIIAFARVPTQMRALRGCKTPQELIELFADYA